MCYGGKICCQEKSHVKVPGCKMGKDGNFVTLRIDSLKPEAYIKIQFVSFREIIIVH